jgi:POLQ-like helicase
MDPDCLAGLVQEVIPENSCLIFCSTKKNCEDVAVLVCKLFPAELKEYRAAERQGLVEAIVRDTGTIMENLRQTILFGVAYHHSGLTSDERRLLEDAFRAGVLCVICCTSTLAAGVNLPCRRVIIRTPYVGRQFMTQSKYKQMIGRAGRAGMGDVGESILICPPRDNINVNNLILSSMDDANSSMHSRQNLGFRNLMLSAIGLGIATTRNELVRLGAQTLLAVQAHKLGQNVKRLTDGMIKMLYQMQALTTKEAAAEQRQALKFCDVSVRIEGTQSEAATQNGSQQAVAKRQISIWPDTPLEISKLGRAAFKAGLDLQKAHTVSDGFSSLFSG